MVNGLRPRTPWPWVGFSLGARRTVCSACCPGSARRDATRRDMKATPNARGVRPGAGSTSVGTFAAAQVDLHPTKPSATQSLESLAHVTHHITEVGFMMT